MNRCGQSYVTLCFQAKNRLGTGGGGHLRVGVTVARPAAAVPLAQLVRRGALAAAGLAAGQALVPVATVRTHKQRVQLLCTQAGRIVLFLFEEAYDTDVVCNTQQSMSVRKPSLCHDGS